MDAIAGAIGFYPPLFEPALQAELAARGGALTFDGVERVRRRVCPDASFQATMIACANGTPAPVVLLEARTAYRKAEAAAMRSGQTSMFAVAEPEAKLRAVSSMPNPAARAARFIIPKNMSIPAGSLIAAHHGETEHVDSSEPVTAVEELSDWRPSNGDPVGYGPIAEFVADVKKILSHAPASLRLRSGDGVGLPHASAERVELNGDALVGEDHEPLIIEREYTLRPPGRTRGGLHHDICRTHGKPYDLIVVATLYAFAHRFSDCTFTSDSNVKELQPGFDLFVTACKPKGDLAALRDRPIAG